MDCTGYLNQRVAKITSKNDKLYIEKFIYYVLNTEKTMKIIKYIIILTFAILTNISFGQKSSINTAKRWFNDLLG